MDKKEIDARSFMLILNIARDSALPMKYCREAQEIISASQPKPTDADREAYFDAHDNGELE